MKLDGLDHFTVVCRDLSESIAFYRDVLGLAVGRRPEFDFPGAWMYLGNRPLVHLVGGRTVQTRETGPFEHVALAAADLDEWRAALRGRGLAFEEAEVPGQPAHQLFLRDPDGVKLELNFQL